VAVDGQVQQALRTQEIKNLETKKVQLLNFPSDEEAVYGQEQSSSGYEDKKRN
jgi:hypothetical protein